MFPRNLREVVSLRKTVKSRVYSRAGCEVSELHTSVGLTRFPASAFHPLFEQLIISSGLFLEEPSQ